MLLLSGTCCSPGPRVSSKWKIKFFGSNRNKPKQDLFRVCFGLFRETQKNFSVCFGVSNLYRNNRNKQNCFETNRNNPEFFFWTLLQYLPVMMCSISDPVPYLDPVAVPASDDMQYLGPISWVQEILLVEALGKRLKSVTIILCQKLIKIKNPQQNNWISKKSWRCFQKLKNKTIFAIITEE